MKILLAACNAKYIHSNPAVYDLKAYAAEFADSIEIHEFTINQTQDEVLKELFLAAPDVLCVSCYIWNIRFITAWTKELKQVLPGTAFWAGGPEVSYAPETFLSEHPEFCGVMIGEGEAVFRELAAGYLSGEPDLSTIPGLAFRDNGVIRLTGLCPPVSLDDIPFIYKDVELFHHRIIYYESSRGCPFSCSYCLSSIDRHLRFRSLSLVLPELQSFLDRKVPQVKFVDRTFNCRKDHAMAIWRYIRDHDNGVTNFHFEISADLLEEDQIRLLGTMRPGLVQLEIGVQSTNPLTLRAIRRSMDFERLARAVRAIARGGNIHQHLDLIAGLPYEDYESFHRSFNQVFQLQPEQLQLGFLKVLKGSRMHEEADTYGIRYKQEAPYEVLSTQWLSYSEILKLKTLETMVEIYYNSGQFQMTTAYGICCTGGDAFRFFERLAGFYEEKGYDRVSHSRMERAEILLEYLGSLPETRDDRSSDLLLYDMYVREKLKSSPSFEQDQKPFEKAVWSYRKEHRIPRTAHVEVFRDGRVILFDYERRDPLTNNAMAVDITDDVKPLTG